MTDKSFIDFAKSHAVQIVGVIFLAGTIAATAVALRDQVAANERTTTRQAQQIDTLERAIAEFKWQQEQQGKSIAMLQLRGDSNADRLGKMEAKLDVVATQIGYIAEQLRQSKGR